MMITKGVALLAVVGLLGCAGEPVADGEDTARRAGVEPVSGGAA